MSYSDPGEWKEHLQGLPDEDIDAMFEQRDLLSEAELETRLKACTTWRQDIEKEKEQLRGKGFSEEEVKRETDATISFILGEEEEMQSMEEYYKRKREK